IKEHTAQEALRPVLRQFWEKHRAKFVRDFDRDSPFHAALKLRLAPQGFDTLIARGRNDFLTPFENLRNGATSNTVLTEQRSGVVPVFAMYPLIHDIINHIGDVKSVMRGFDSSKVSDYQPALDEVTNTIVPLANQLATCRKYRGKESGIRF